jgi:NAD(P)-dependent dehydrogenase (short-subunit alcohol dehydrogenase family)
VNIDLRPLARQVPAETAGQRRAVICDILEDLPDGTPYPKARQEDLDQTAALVEAQGRRCIALKADVGDPGQARDLVQRAIRDLGRLDYLVSNAAFTLEGPIAEIELESFEAVVRANLVGAFNVLPPALKQTIAQRFGRVVMIGSGASRHGVAVNAVLPGPTDTPMMDNPIRYQQAVPDKPAPTRDDYLEAKKNATPMGLAWVKPEDVTAAVLFLLSDEARSISGDSLSFDAGDSGHWT